MGEDLNELYQEVILDHCRKPRHFHALPEANRTAEGKNPFCGDNFTVYLKLEDDLIQDISFQGSGCCISKASASMMTGQIKGKSVADAHGDIFTRCTFDGDNRGRRRGTGRQIARLRRSPPLSNAGQVRHIAVARDAGGS